MGSAGRMMLPGFLHRGFHSLHMSASAQAASREYSQRPDVCETGRAGPTWARSAWVRGLAACGPVRCATGRATERVRRASLTREGVPGCPSPGSTSAVSGVTVYPTFRLSEHWSSVRPLFDHFVPAFTHSVSQQMRDNRLLVEPIQEGKAFSLITHSQLKKVAGMCSSCIKKASVLKSGSIPPFLLSTIGHPSCNQEKRVSLEI